MNSVLNKIKRAAGPDKATHPVVASTKARDLPAARDWTQTRTRGRPRNEFAKHRLQQHPVEQFVEACLLHDPECSEFIGSNRQRLVETVEGDFVRVAPRYERVTLLGAYLQYCAENHYLAVAPRTFVGLVRKACLERGWQVREGRAGDSRRRILRGISIKGQAPFNGVDDRFLGDHKDRKLWIRKDQRTPPADRKAPELLQSTHHLEVTP